MNCSTKATRSTPNAIATLRWLVCFVSTLLLFWGSGAAVADSSSRVEFSVDGQLHSLPMVSSDYQVQVDGNVANVKLRQVFANNQDQPVHARYLFPLNKEAAVHRMRLIVGNEQIDAVIEPIKKAEKIYQVAKAQGKAAAILKQHRPNMFTQRIANLMPGMPVEVELEYLQVLPKIDGEYELVIPTVVGPRFDPKSSARAAGGSMATLPTYPVVPGLRGSGPIAKNSLSVRVEVDAGQPVSGVASSTHAIHVTENSPSQAVVELQAGATLPNRDFVLRYALADSELSAGLVSHWSSDESGYFNLLIEPPLQAASQPSVAREMVFLLDCSGSMFGLPMDASKAFMRRALKSLGPKDSFRIVRFSDVATEFSSKPLAATPENIRAGLAYTAALQGSGGTIMSSGVYQALAAPALSGSVRQVVFLTDGYIGNELEILRLVTKYLGDARLYSFGVGTSVNRYLLDELARVGRGFADYMDPTADVEEAAMNLAARLQHPVLTQLSINWQELPVTEVLPVQLPDLFAGQSVQVQGRFFAPAAGAIRIEGMNANGERVQFESWLELTSSGGKPALAQTWARAKVRGVMHQFTAPEQLRERSESGQAPTDADLQAQVTQLGLAHRLVTQWTAFVAVSKKLVNPDPGATLPEDVPLEPVAGVANSAYPASAFSGYGTPEPGEWASLTLLLLLAGLYVWICRRPRFALKRWA